MIQLRGEEFAYHEGGYGFDHQQGKKQCCLVLEGIVSHQKASLFSSLYVENLCM